MRKTLCAAHWRVFRRKLPAQFSLLQLVRMHKSVPKGFVTVFFCLRKGASCCVSLMVWVICKRLKALCSTHAFCQLPVYRELFYACGHPFHIVSVMLIIRQSKIWIRMIPGYLRQTLITYFLQLPPLSNASESHKRSMQIIATSNRIASSSNCPNVEFNLCDVKYEDSIFLSS